MCAAEVNTIFAGKSYLVTNQKSLVQCMEALSQKLQPGVVMHFKKIAGKGSPSRDVEMMDVDGTWEGSHT